MKYIKRFNKQIQKRLETWKKILIRFRKLNKKEEYYWWLKKFKNKIIWKYYFKNRLKYFKYKTIKVFNFL
jgi:hypothetical protein